MSTAFRSCAWCSALTDGRDEDGDPACPAGEGCARTAPAPVARVRPYGGKGRPRREVSVAGRTRTLGEWARLLDVRADTLRASASERGIELRAEIARRLAR